MLPNHILHNAYRILGLGSSSSQRDILKRYREITVRLKIDDCPRYDLDLDLDLDLGLSDSLRTGIHAGDALKKLQNPKSRITEYFFWFDISDDIDEEAFEYLLHDPIQFDRAAQIWKRHLDTGAFAALIYKKNIAILYCLSLFDKEDDSLLRESISIWHELTNSDRFWALFARKYGASGGSGMNANLTARLRKSITAHISDVYYDLYVRHADAKYVKEFHAVFGTFGGEIEKRLFGPIRQSVYEAIEELGGIWKENDTDPVYAKCDNCKRSEPHFSYKDGSMLCRECHETVGTQWQNSVDHTETVEGSGKMLRRVYRAVEKLELAMKQLQKTGLYETVLVRMMRDHAAKAIMNASRVIYNQAHMRKEPLKLLYRGKSISATIPTKEELESDSRIILNNMKIEDGNISVIETGGAQKNRLVVQDNFMEYGISKIYYDDISSIMCNRSGDIYVFKITSPHDTISLELDRPSLNDLIDKISLLVEPCLVKNLVRMIFKGDNAINVGQVRFDKIGYHDSETGESVMWDDEVYSPTKNDGRYILYKFKNGIQRHFTYISADEPNAMIIPALVKACHGEFHMHSKSWPA